MAFCLASSLVVILLNNMNKKFPIIFLVFSIIILGVSLSSVFAKNQDNPENQILPEKEGTYNVPGRPDLKLKVFVHHVGGKPNDNGKPSGGQTNICYLSDPDSASFVGAAGWKLPVGTWVYTLNTNSVPSSVGTFNLAIMAIDAFNRWSKHRWRINR
jgi:hypothetical protein